MKTLILIGALALAACSDSRPVVDIQQSKDPSKVQTDMHHCLWIAEYYNLDKVTATERCLNGRGHVYLGEENG